MTTENLPESLDLQSVGESTPIPAGDRPTTWHGQPVKYIWKDVIRLGQYTHPKTGVNLSVTPERLEKWEKSFRRMQENGVKVYVPVNHSRKTEDNRGYVIDAKREGGRLHLLHQLIGEDAIRDAARSEVSVRIVPNFRDGSGNVYDEAIEHSSLVVNPVINQQQPAIAASRGDASDGTAFILSADFSHTGDSAMADATKHSPELVERVKGFVGPDLAKTVTDENALDILFAHAEANSTQLSRTEEAVVALETERDTLRSQVVDLSRDGDDQLTDREIVFGRKAVGASADRAVATGRITPATRKAIDELLTPAISLSVTSGSDDLLGAKLYDILANNTPVDLSAQTGVQVLSRQTPSDSREDEQANGEPLYKRMAAAYSDAK